MTKEPHITVRIPAGPFVILSTNPIRPVIIEVEGCVWLLTDRISLPDLVKGLAVGTVKKNGNGTWLREVRMLMGARGSVQGWYYADDPGRQRITLWD